MRRTRFPCRKDPIVYMNIKIRRQKTEVRSQTSCLRSLKPTATHYSLLIAHCFMFLLLADNVNAAGCTLLEPEALKKAIENKSIYEMIIFDVRPRYTPDSKRRFDIETNMKRIPSSLWAPREKIELDLVGKVEELIDKNVILVGENTESAESVCRFMMKKDYGIRNIYVLKGGMEKWDGPVKEDITKVECEMITSRELMNMMKSGKNVEIIDKRSDDEYHEGHIPSAVLQPGEIRQPSLKYLIRKREWRIKRARENATIVYVYENEVQAMLDCKYEKYFTHPAWYPHGEEIAKKNIYVLRGGMRVWEGEVKRDYLEILKKKVKEKLK